MITLSSNPSRCLAGIGDPNLLYKAPVTFKSNKNNKQWLTLGYWPLNSGTELAMWQSNCNAKECVLRKDFLDILKNQMWWNSLENFYWLIHIVLRNSKKWKHVLYIHFVVLKESMVDVHIQTSQKFLLLFACPTVMVLEVNTSNTMFFWIPR